MAYHRIGVAAECWVDARWGLLLKCAGLFEQTLPPLDNRLAGRSE